MHYSILPHGCCIYLGTARPSFLPFFGVVVWLSIDFDQNGIEGTADRPRVVAFVVITTAADDLVAHFSSVINVCASEIKEQGKYADDRDDGTRRTSIFIDLWCDQMFRRFLVSPLIRGKWMMTTAESLYRVPCPVR